MLIKQSSIRSVDRYLSCVQKYPAVRLVARVIPELSNRAIKAGFSVNSRSGDTVLPNIVGSCSKFNAEGKFLIRKDLPKEERYITTAEWSWEQWCGRNQTKTVTEYRDIYKECYQREFIPPPSLELTWVEHDNGKFVSSEKVETNTLEPDFFKHAINLFLELFGECEICKDDFSGFRVPLIKRLNWELLPSGKYPWEKVNRHVKNLVSDKHSKYSNVILDRQESIVRFEPDDVYIGTGGFRSYVAYVFRSKKIVVLESILTGNATYVFGENWKKFSMLSKAEILDNNFQKDRIIHSKGWEGRLEVILRPEQLLAV